MSRISRTTSAVMQLTEDHKKDFKKKAEKKNADYKRKAAQFIDSHKDRIVAADGVYDGPAVLDLEAFLIYSALDIAVTFTGGISGTLTFDGKAFGFGVGDITAAGYANFVSDPSQLNDSGSVTIYAVAADGGGLYAEFFDSQGVQVGTYFAAGVGEVFAAENISGTYYFSS